jgi:hypothetical protein
MFVAFMPMHFLLCDEVLPYFVLRVDVVHSLNLNLNQKGFEFMRSRGYGLPHNLANLIRVNG